MTYYRLLSPDTGKNIMMRRASHREIHTTGGGFIDPRTIDSPFDIEMFVGDDYGYDQYDSDFDGEVVELTIEERLRDYYCLPCIMTPKLVEVLKVAGVDNLQTFPTKISNSETGELLPREYLFVNIVGMVPCADLSSSEHSPLGSTFSFHELKIDENRTLGMPLFRLAESPSEVLVDEKAATAIKAGGFAGLTVEAIT